MSGHTPGPWRAGFNAGFGDDGQLIAGAWIEAGEFRSLATLIPVREVKANASLMASAPDLLAALKMLLDDVEDYQRINRLGGENNLSQVAARAAIARAEGRS